MGYVTSYFLRDKKVIEMPLRINPTRVILNLFQDLAHVRYHLPKVTYSPL